MRKTLITVAVAGLFSIPTVVMAQAAAAPASPHTFTGNVGFATDYLYRGISQTSGEPALQGGFDYAHSSGLYAGTWASNVSWIQDGLNVPGALQTTNAGLEIDVYGGYKGTVTGDLGFDVGVLTYNYPGKNKTPGGILKQDTQEIYGALSWKWLTVKYSHSLGALFGWAKTPSATANQKRQIPVRVKRHRKSLKIKSGRWTVDIAKGPTHAVPFPGFAVRLAAGEEKSTIQYRYPADWVVSHGVRSARSRPVD